MATFVEFNTQADGRVALNADRITLVQKGSANYWGEGTVIIESDDDNLTDGEMVSDSWEFVLTILKSLPGAQFLEVAEHIGISMLINAAYIVRVSRGQDGSAVVIMRDRCAEDLELTLVEQYEHFLVRITSASTS